MHQFSPGKNGIPNAPIRIYLFDARETLPIKYRILQFVCNLKRISRFYAVRDT
jgi:hypothetical protein